MARHGVDFDSVKQAALKLLSKGVSPSVQRIRELLGTGSNTTIAEHLKIWREEHAAKKVHHLPASIPEELIATFETLWQTAMEYAEKQMADIKESLNQQEQNLKEEKIVADKAVDDLKLQLTKLQEKIEIKTSENQTLQTKLAIVDERYEKQIAEINKLEQQYELRLKHLLGEKHGAIEKVEKLQSEIQKLQLSITEQSEKHQFILAKERELQEESEIRWTKLIDQARTETSEQRKRFENTISKQAIQIEKLQSMLSGLQEKYTMQQSTLNLKNARITELSEQCEQIQIKYMEASTTVAVLQERVNYTTKKTGKFKNKIQPTQ